MWLANSGVFQFLISIFSLKTFILSMDFKNVSHLVITFNFEITLREDLCNIKYYSENSKVKNKVNSLLVLVLSILVSTVWRQMLKRSIESFHFIMSIFRSKLKTTLNEIINGNHDNVNCNRYKENHESTHTRAPQKCSFRDHPDQIPKLLEKIEI